MRFKWPRKLQGVHPRQNKNTANSAIEKIRGFDTVSIPLDMQFGPGCESLVKKGDHVEIGQKIGEPLGAWCVPIHASVSGTVKSVKKEILSDGTPVEYVNIDSDGKDSVSAEVKPPQVHDRADFLAAVRASGLVGLGGAAFPTHVKMNPPPGKTIDTLIINAAECEPYITSDHRICLEYPQQIIKGITLTCHYLNIPTAVIALEDNKRDVVTVLQREIDKVKGTLDYPEQGISITVLPTQYPTGAEKVLIKLVNERIVPEGGLPADVGVLVQNVGTIRYVGEYFETGMPLVSKIITLDGSAVQKPGNYEVPIGAIIEDVVEKSGGCRTEVAKVIMGGPMMGVSIDDLSRSILKANNAILMLDEKDATLPTEIACIQCGRCTFACPMLLMPTTLDKAARAQDISKLNDYHVMNCIECGCCTYVCPSKRYLLQNIRIGKTLVKQASKN